MLKRASGLGVLSLVLAMAITVPTEIQLPGTQPGEVSLEPPNKCDNCHAGYDPAVEPYYNWVGGMMAHASRDPLFWASVAIAEQDFDADMSEFGFDCVRMPFSALIQQA